MAIPHSASYLYFQSYAFQVNKSGGHDERIVKVLCGDQPPTVIDGYGIWQVINRPLRQGIAIPQGFNPARMQFNVRFGVWNGKFGFDGWDTGIRPNNQPYDSRAAVQVEDDISNLHWMAGGNSLGGPSPVVYADSYNFADGTRTETDLIPRQYHGVAWIIDQGITWGTCLRNRYGQRIYQEAAFTTMGYDSVLGNAPPPGQQNSGDGTSGGSFFKTTAQVRRAVSIAASSYGQSFGGRSAGTPVQVESLARSILADARNNPIAGTKISLGRRSMTWDIPIGYNVWVP